MMTSRRVVFFSGNKMCIDEDEWTSVLAKFFLKMFRNFFCKKIVVYWSTGNFTQVGRVSIKDGRNNRSIRRDFQPLSLKISLKSSLYSDFRIGWSRPVRLSPTIASSAVFKTFLDQYFQFGFRSSHVAYLRMRLQTCSGNFSQLQISVNFLQFLKQTLSRQPCERLLASPKRQLLHEGQLMMMGEFPSSCHSKLFHDFPIDFLLCWAVVV